VAAGDGGAQRDAHRHFPGGIHAGEVGGDGGGHAGIGGDRGPLIGGRDQGLAARPAGISFAAANPRHEHEWKVWEQVRVPDEKVLVPGVIDVTSNYVEHPELVAERILRYARIVGPARVVAGTDCGFGTFAGLETVDAEVCWSKLEALAEGARIATRMLRRGMREPVVIARA
jgi:hypothetical protein